MPDSPLSTVGKIPVELPDGRVVLVDAPNRMDKLLRVPFTPDLIHDMQLLEHHERVPVICGWHAKGELSAGHLNELLCATWAIGAYPYEVGCDVADWVNLFECGVFVADRPGTTPPTDVLTVWRGGSPGAQRGMAWTTDKAVAERFAKGSVWKQGVAELWRATIAPKCVFGLLFDRNESEVILSPYGLDEVITLATFVGETGRRWD